MNCTRDKDALWEFLEQGYHGGDTSASARTSSSPGPELADATCPRLTRGGGTDSIAL